MERSNLEDYFNVRLDIKADYDPIAGASTLDGYIFVLIPTDEWSGDFIDPYLEYAGLEDKNYLDIDSISFPKREIAAPLRELLAPGSALDPKIWVKYRENTNGAIVFQANADQRVFVMGMVYSIAYDVWFADFSVLNTIKAGRNSRYLGYRGDL